MRDDLRLAVETRWDAATSPWGVPAIRHRIELGAVPVGTISLRLGDTWRVTHLAGHVGVTIDTAYRGQGIAGRAVDALLQAVDAARLFPLSFTTTPDNAASRRMLEKLGCVLVDVVPIPADYDSYARGERLKLRYLLPR